MTEQQKHFLWSSVRTVSAVGAAAILEWLLANLSTVVGNFVADPAVAASVLGVLTIIIRILIPAVRGTAGATS